MLPDNEELTACACVLHKTGTRLIEALERWDKELQLKLPDRMQEMVDGLGRTHLDCKEMLTAAMAFRTDRKLTKPVDDMVKILGEIGGAVIERWQKASKLPSKCERLQTTWRSMNPLALLHKRVAKWQTVLERCIHQHRVNTSKQQSSPPLDPNRLTFFVASSSEAKATAKKLIKTIQKASVGKKWEVLFWNDPGVFVKGESTLESLEEILRKCDFGIYLLTADDRLVTRRKQTLTPRGNVVFELGMGVARHGRRRSLIIHEKVYQISDLHGISTVPFDKPKNATTPSAAEVERIIKEIVIAVNKEAARSNKS